MYKNMKEAKKTDSVPGDIPATILKEFLPEFATPVTAILKQAVETHTWPDIYNKGQNRTNYGQFRQFKTYKIVADYYVSCIQ